MKDEDRAFSAELCYALTTVLVQVRGKDFVNEVFSMDMMNSMVNLVQWRQDPKTNLGNTNKVAWDAAVANILLLLSSLLSRPDETLVAAGIDLQALGGTTLMLARPGKAPRKAIDVKAALVRFVDGSDASSAMSAQRVLDRLF
jgi:hypothetical protein